MKRQGHLNPNYQQIATHFEVGNQVVPELAPVEQAGRIVALFPAIGMAEVQFSYGNKRYPVEELRKLNDSCWVDPPTHDSVPGGLPVDEVSGGPNASRVASAFVKKALYWGAKDRKYRATKQEQDSGKFICPRCRENTLRKAIYKMQEGKRVRLMGCTGCMFLIREDDIARQPQQEVEISIKTDGKEVEVKV